MAETLESLAQRLDEIAEQMATRAQVDELTRRIQAVEDATRTNEAAIRTQASSMASRADLDRFATRDDLKQFATRAQMDEMKSALQTQIEAADAKVGLVLEKVDHLIKRDIHHSVVHARFDQRLENHELRMLGLEDRHKPPSPD